MRPFCSLWPTTSPFDDESQASLIVFCCKTRHSCPHQPLPATRSYISHVVPNPPFPPPLMSPFPSVVLDPALHSDRDDLDLDPPLSLAFPTSSVRDDPCPPPIRSPPSSVPPLSPQPAPLTCSTSYSTYVPPLRYVSPGVLENGALTIAHPDVRRFLDQADTTPPPPVPTPRPIFALAALGLFYHPKKPAHWLFWSKPKREQTARVVHKVLSAYMLRAHVQDDTHNDVANHEQIPPASCTHPSHGLGSPRA